jgi:hypothetical protein
VKISGYSLCHRLRLTATLSEELMANPCRSCSLFKSDKNNPLCLKCSKRISYVNALENELSFTAPRSDLATSITRFATLSKEVPYFAVIPETLFE